MAEIPREKLAQWASTKPSIKVIYVFGSYARNEARPDSDLDLAFEFLDPDDALAELITNAAAWKAELTKLTGILVKDLYLDNDVPAQGPRVEVFRR